MNIKVWILLLVAAALVGCSIGERTKYYENGLVKSENGRIALQADLAAKDSECFRQMKGYKPQKQMDVSKLDSHAQLAYMLKQPAQVRQVHPCNEKFVAMQKAAGEKSANRHRTAGKVLDGAVKWGAIGGFFGWLLGSRRGNQGDTENNSIVVNGREGGGRGGSALTGGGGSNTDNSTNTPTATDFIITQGDNNSTEQGLKTNAIDFTDTTFTDSSTTTETTTTDDTTSGATTSADSSSGTTTSSDSSASTTE